MKDAERLHERRDLRDDLYRTGSGADDTHALVGEIDLVVPARRVHDGASKVDESGNVGQFEFRQRPGRQDHAGSEELAVVGREAPLADRFVEGHVSDVVIELNELAQFVAVG